jgi:hypothetical protein
MGGWADYFTADDAAYASEILARYGFIAGLDRNDARWVPRDGVDRGWGRPANP